MCFCTHSCLPQISSVLLGTASPVGFHFALFAALKEAGSLKPGETVLVTAAAGGTGQFAVQLAKLAGCHVVGAGAAQQSLSTGPAQKLLNTGAALYPQRTPLQLTCRWARCNAERLRTQGTGAAAADAHCWRAMCWELVNWLSCLFTGRHIPARFCCF
eukprot:1145431-Pelagomonas_calceolata.AAC.8